MLVPLSVLRVQYYSMSLVTLRNMVVQLQYIILNNIYKTVIKFT